MPFAAGNADLDASAIGMLGNNRCDSGYGEADLLDRLIRPFENGADIQDAALAARPECGRRLGQGAVLAGA
jgi:hypothetical protein